MKKSIFVLFLFSASILIAQQPTNSIFNFKKSNDDLLLLNNSKFSLNMDSFKSDDVKQNAFSLSQLLQESYNQREIPANNMPIFSPEGKFFLEIYDVEEDIDYKLKIFDLEKSKYFLRSVA